MRNRDSIATPIATKTLTVRLPEALVADIEEESRARRLPKSEVVRERLTAKRVIRQTAPSFEAIAHLVGSVDGLPDDLSGRVKQALAATRYGEKRPRR